MFGSGSFFAGGGRILTGMSSSCQNNSHSISAGILALCDDVCHATFDW